MKKLLCILSICAIGMDIKSQVIDSTFGIPTSLDPCCIIYSGTGCNYGGLDQAFLAVHLEDGRIILAGDTRWQGESDFAIARLMPDGQYDQTAGPNGQVRIDLGYQNDSCLTAAQYLSNHILMGGCVWQAGTAGYVNLIARIDFDGKLDNSFGNSGHLAIDLPTAHEMITRILPQPDGKILVGGNAYYGGSYDFPDSVDVFVARLFPDGQIDSTFGENGFFFHRWEWRCNVALLGDLSLDKFGRIVLTGGSYDPYPFNYGGNDFCYQNIFLYRCLPNGQPDQNFGANGSLEVPYTHNGRGNAVLHYEDGRILLAGAAGEPSTLPAYAFFARFMPDGTPDIVFGENGRFKKALFNYGFFSGGQVEPFGLLRMRGRILAGVSNEITGDDPGFGAICLTEAGKLDSTFGHAGRFNPLPDLGLQSFINQISSTADDNFFLSGYTRILQPNNMAIFKVRWDGSSASNELFEPNKIKIYPNPVQNGFFNIDLGFGDSLSGTLILKIRNVNGSILVEQNHVGGSSVIHIPDVQNGVYFVELLGEQTHFVGKMVVQNK